MKHYLSYNGQLEITEDDELAKRLLARKRVRVDPPDYDPAIEALEWKDGKWVKRDLTPEEIAAFARKEWPTVADFWAEFEPSEKLGIITSKEPGIMLLHSELVMWRGPVWSDDARVQQGLGGLVALGILTSERKDAILEK